MARRVLPVGLRLRSRGIEPREATLSGDRPCDRGAAGGLAVGTLSDSLAPLLRRAYPRVLARTLAFARNLPEAEDAVQDAVLRALASWPKRGVPDSPEAWLTTVATNAHRDRLRKGRWEQPQTEALDALAEMSPWARIAVGEPDVARSWKDELLRLVFACCHPALQPGESAALCLATVVGLSCQEVARAFLTEPRTMEQRLTRARKRLRERGDPDGASPERSRDRLDAVLCVVHLLFNEGYWSHSTSTPIRADLCRLAVGLAHSLGEAFPDEPEALALLALLRLHDARRDARTGGDGRPVALPDQDRSRWDRQAIALACATLDTAAALGQPGPLQIEAAISAIHCRAATPEATDWREIALLYERLEGFRPTPAVRVNRAFALGQACGAEAGLALLDDHGELDAARSPYYHLVRGCLLAEAGSFKAARPELERAVEVARNPAEREQIEARIAALRKPTLRDANEPPDPNPSPPTTVAPPPRRATVRTPK
ncbi:MAG: sigma-70 family RNA polymerase sigma factor [Myxococcales bacterium FL481]|nr:MAG: sigma-70 family RNA polymerase sigma factor [Myxococcales bacterium FL481]